MSIVRSRACYDDTATVPEIVTEHVNDGSIGIFVVYTDNVGTQGHCDYGLDPNHTILDHCPIKPGMEKTPSWQQMNRGMKSKKQRRSLK